MALMDNTQNYNEKRFLFLIGKIPNWEVYLTDKQLECAKLYISSFDTYLVDDKLNLNHGITYGRLFGSGNSKGALGKLEDVYAKLDKYGYFDKPKEKDNSKNSNKSIVSDKTLEKVKELFTLIKQFEGYDKHLTESQNERLYYFLKTRSFKECAKYFGISEITFKQCILGRDENSGILGKLKKIYNENVVDSWDDI